MRDRKSRYSSLDVRDQGHSSRVYVGSKVRGRCGQQIAEAGPAFFILLICILFPMLDLLYYGFAFGAAWYLHQLEARAVSVSQPPFPPPSTFEGHVIPELAAKEDIFVHSGIGQFIKITDLFCQVQQIPDPTNPAVVGSSILTNQFFIQAMVPLPIPYFVNIPSINGTGTVFTYSSTVLQEEKGLN